MDRKQNKLRIGQQKHFSILRDEPVGKPQEFNQKMFETFCFTVSQCRKFCKESFVVFPEVSGNCKSFCRHRFVGCIKLGYQLREYHQKMWETFCSQEIFRKEAFFVIFCFWFEKPMLLGSITIFRAKYFASKNRNSL